ncbi:MAG TPA: TSUP family transporter [Rhizomicrobium sp.]
MPFSATLAILFCASIWAGAQNALAGGGSFVTLPALMLTGMDARAANITSTIALFPAQIATGWTGRKFVSGAAELSFAVLGAISLVGGAVGALLLLITPASFFAHLVPWLVLFATAVFAWGSFGPKTDATRRLGRGGVAAAQFLIAIYGGYFGGGIGFLMLAALTAAGLLIRTAGATKNALAAIMNASAAAIFVFSPEVRWLQAAVCSAGAVAGGIAGALMLARVNERVLRVAVILLGVALTAGLFVRAP